MKTQTRLARRKQRRTYRIRKHVRKSAYGRPRLSVFRSNSHIYAQIIDDQSGHTLAAASTLDKEIAGPGQNAANVEAASKVGQLIAERAQAEGIQQVVFDRGGYKFHGRVKALADSARECGLSF